MKTSHFQLVGIQVFAASMLVNASVTTAFAQDDLQTVRVAWCTQTLNVTAAPLAVAEKMGWFQEGGVKVHLVPLPGSADCARNVATGEVDAAVAAPEPLAVLRTQGVDLKIFYTAYRRNIFGLAVPENSDVQTYEDLRGKKIGVTSMGSVGVIIARSVAADAGLNPDRDIRIVVSGEPAQSASLLRSGEVEALSQWDTNYLLIERAGVPMRRIEDPQIASFPSNSLIALQTTIDQKSKELAAVARGYAMGTVFAIKNPAAASEIMYEVYPDIRPTGLDPETVRSIDMKTLAERARVWALEEGQRWGESNPEIYQRYVEWLQKWDIVKGEVEAKYIISNALLDDINDFDSLAVEKAAADY